MWLSKDAEFEADFECVENDKKITSEKLEDPERLKAETYYLQLFRRFKISIKLCIFCNTNLIFQIIFYGHILTFSKLEARTK
jgi:hypothetical protein